MTHSNLAFGDLMSRLAVWPMTLGTMIPMGAIGLLARLGIAGIFWRSAMTKITLFVDVGNFSFAQFWAVLTLNWEVSPVTYTLFEYEYALPVIPPAWAAHLALMAEIILPLLLLLGLATRLSAMAVFVMTLVIQLFVYPNLWPDHALWSAAALYLMAKGAGVMSLDYLITRRFLP